MPKVSVFSQIIKLIPRSNFEGSVARHQGDKGVRTLDCWTWFGSLIFSQLSGHDSIRALQRVFTAGNKEALRLGFGALCRSTLSDANSKRPVAILEEMLSFSLELAKKARGSKLHFGFPVYLLDSTFIELCISLCPWAEFSRNKFKSSAGIKLHTAIDLTGHIPEFALVKDGPERENRDLQVARENFKFNPGSLVVFDRGYWSAGYFNDLNHNKVGFVTRMRKPIRFRVVKSEKTNRTQGFICDQHIYLNGCDTKKKYTGKLRRIVYFDPQTKRRFAFVTNRFDLPTKVVCELYKSRWQVEIFFRILKQNLKIKKFLGLNKNAVLAQVYAALICYVLLAYLKLTARSSIPMTDLMAVVGTLLLIKQDILGLIQDAPKTTRHPPPIQLSLAL